MQILLQVIHHLIPMQRRQRQPARRRLLSDVGDQVVGQNDLAGAKFTMFLLAQAIVASGRPRTPDVRRSAEVVHQADLRGRVGRVKGRPLRHIAEEDADRVRIAAERESGGLHERSAGVRLVSSGGTGQPTGRRESSPHSRFPPIVLP